MEGMAWRQARYLVYDRKRELDTSLQMDSHGPNSEDVVGGMENSVALVEPNPSPDDIEEVTIPLLRMPTKYMGILQNLLSLPFLSELQAKRATFSRDKYIMHLLGGNFVVSIISGEPVLQFVLPLSADLKPKLVREDSIQKPPFLGVKKESHL
jgi:hypothetical protein